VDREGSDA